MYRIEPLAGRHDRSGFDCGVEALNDFLKSKASQYERRDLSRTFVAARVSTPEGVVGYYSLASGGVSVDVLPETQRMKLPRHPVPVAHLGRLAVALSERGQGLGRLLLTDALARAERLADEMGIVAVEVYAKDDAAKGFYLKYGFVELVDDRRHLYLPMKVIRQLDLNKER